MRSMAAQTQMAQQLQRGQKVDIDKARPEIKHLEVEVGWNTSSNLDVDVAAFLLDGNGKAAGDDDMVFYGQQRHPSGSVIHEGGDDGEERLRIDLVAIPERVEKIDFTATIYDADKRGQSFQQVRNLHVQVSDKSSGSRICRYDAEQGALQKETAVVIGELYRHNGNWKFQAIGAGYNGGLAALTKSYGLEVTDSQISATRHESKVKSTPKIEPKSTVSLKKVELKKGRKVSLVKKNNEALGEISINLNWHQGNPNGSSGGFFSALFGSRNNGAIDLDLGCLFELYDGQKGTVQALGNAFGSLERAPYIALDGDDRTGASIGGETLRINGKKVNKIKRVLVYTFIYDGIANWQQADGVVTIKCPGSPDIIVKMDEYGSNKIMCGIAMLENDGHGSFTISKIVQFYNGHKYLDEAFGWGLRWVRGRKD